MVQLYKSFIWSKLKYIIILWGHTSHILQHSKHLENAQKEALLLILTVMKSTLTKTFDSELSISPIDLRLEELQCMEALYLLQKNEPYIIENMKTVKNNTSNPSRNPIQASSY